MYRTLKRSTFWANFLNISRLFLDSRIKRNVIIASLELPIFLLFPSSVLSIPYSARKSGHFPHPAEHFGPIPHPVWLLLHLNLKSRDIVSRILYSADIKKSNRASRKTPSGAPLYLNHCFSLSQKVLFHPFSLQFQNVWKYSSSQIPSEEGEKAITFNWLLSFFIILLTKKDNIQVSKPIKTTQVLRKIKKWEWCWWYNNKIQIQKTNINSDLWFLVQYLLWEGRALCIAQFAETKIWRSVQN